MSLHVIFTCNPPLAEYHGHIRSRIRMIDKLHNLIELEHCRQKQTNKQNLKKKKKLKNLLQNIICAPNSDVKVQDLEADLDQRLKNFVFYLHLPHMYGMSH